MKKIKYWNTRNQVGLLFFGVGLLIAINFFFIYRSNRITRSREATVQLIQESIANVNLMGFFASNIANGADEFKAGLKAYIEQLEENLEFLENGGTIIQNEKSLRIQRLPERAIDSYAAFIDLWATYKASLEVLQNTPSKDTYQFSAYEPYEEVSDTGTIVTQYRPFYQSVDVPNPAVLSKVTEVSKQTGTLATNLETLREELNDFYWFRRFAFQSATVFSSILSVAGLVIAFYILLLRLFNPLHEVQSITEKIAEGDLDCELPEQGFGEVVNLSKILNRLLERLVSATNFANEIGRGEFESEFHPASNEDKLGYALLEMRNNLRRVAEEDSKRNWSNEGMAKFGDILRTNFDSEEELAYSIVSNLVKYLNVNQGGLFAIEEDFNGDQSLNLLASYAYGRRKFLERKLDLGEGLIGQAALEGNIIYLTDIPEEYALIQSGMGEGSPSSIIILPLKTNDQVFGVLELASFETIPRYQIDFLEKISESVTSTLATSRTNQKTKLLLEDSQQMTEEMKAQEEEMRQNMEELQATQEEMARKQKELAQNDHRFRQMTQNVPGMIFQLQMDANGTCKFAFVSSASKAMLGLIPEEVVEAPDHEEVLRLIAEDRDNYRKSLLTSAQSLTPMNWEGRIVGEDGKSVLWITISAQPERDDQDQVLWNGLLTDITEKKRNEEQMRVMIKQLEAKDAQVTENMEALEQTKEELQFLNREMGAIMTSIEDSVFMLELNKELKIRKTNENMLTYLGYEGKALARKELKILFDNDVTNTQYFSEMQTVLLQGKYLETYTLWNNNKGEGAWVHLMFFPTLNDSGKLIKIACIGSPLPDSLIPQQPMVL
ncbi:MAG TPA: hypothetical protein DCE41_00100 [Cytophagales bacterium]|nr:hypothetical protein [Cytophagales bacterium]HAA18830.1 hypothetical protein [Cytophagales bacterium]HAP60893.1 hypothetical protein [Cytophagales bacterium]